MYVRMYILLQNSFLIFMKNVLARLKQERHLISIWRQIYVYISCIISSTILHTNCRLASALAAAPVAQTLTHNHAKRKETTPCGVAVSLSAALTELKCIREGLRNRLIYTIIRLDQFLLLLYISEYNPFVYVSKVNTNKKIGEPTVA